MYCKPLSDAIHELDNATAASKEAVQLNDARATGLETAAKKIQDLQQCLKPFPKRLDQLHRELAEKISGLFVLLKQRNAVAPPYTDDQSNAIREAADALLSQAMTVYVAEITARFEQPCAVALWLTGRTLGVYIASAILAAIAAGILAASGIQYWVRDEKGASIWVGIATGLIVAVLFAVFYFVSCADCTANRGAASAPANGSTQAGAWWQYVLFGGMGFAALVSLILGVFSGTQTSALSATATARGVITFLIAVGTIAIAVILVLASVLMNRGQENGLDELKERLSKGKEILAVLVGVLGTIVGFYFAANTGNSKPVITDLKYSDNVAADSTFKVTAQAIGGKVPYESTPIATGDGATITNVPGGNVDESGKITVTFKVDAGAKLGNHSFLLGVRDNAGETATVRHEFAVVGSVPPPAKDSVALPTKNSVILPTKKSAAPTAKSS